MVSVQIAVGKEIDDNRLASLKDRFPDVTFGQVERDPEIMREAVGYIGRIGPEAYALAGERLRWVHSTGAGVETILAIPGVVESEIVVTNTRGAHAPFVAEHAFALMLSLTRCLPEFGQAQRDHVYRAFGRGVTMDSLYGKRILIIGMGNIGSAIARRALGFEMHVIGLDVRVPDVISGETPILSIEHLDHELRQADVVVVTVPRTAETEGMLDARRIGLLKDGALLIGVSRGRIVDEEALAARLREGSLAGAGLDVFSEEPLPPEHFLWDTPRLVMTPHCAPNSPSTRDREFEITVENIRRFVEDEPLLNVCDKVAGY